MAKRVAARELNHDNWDQEEEEEEAGTFQKASEDEIKGRVIKKAKRRNLTQDGKTNVFSGLSFASSAAKQTESSFSWLKPAATTGNVFSDTSANKPTFGSLVFGSTVKPADELAAKPFGGFVFGKPKLEESSEMNNEDGEVTVNGSTDVKKNGEEKSHSPNSADSVLKANGGGFNFAGTALENKTAESKWTCDICMISNNADKTKCAACETPNPAQKSKEESKANGGGFNFAGTALENKAAKVETTFGTNGGFNFSGTNLDKSSTAGAGSGAATKWTCDICMIKNSEDLNKCAACETPKPGAALPTKEKSPVKISFGSSGGFKFGGGSTNDSAPPSNGGGFTFGSGTAAAAPSNTSTETGGFKFGGSTGGFTFGTTTTEKEPSKESEGGGFKFGSTEKESSKESEGGGFKFGSTEKESSNESGGGGFKFGCTEKESEKPATGGLKFGSTEMKDLKESVTPSSGGFKFGSSAAEPEKPATAGFKFGSGSTSPSTPLGFTFTNTSNTSFGAPRGPFGTPAGQKTSQEQTPSKVAAGSKKAEYLGQIKALNLQVTSLINKHIDKNVLVDLSPVFQDYMKHINNIRAKYEVQPKTCSVSSETETPLSQDGEKENETTGGEGEETFEHKEENSFFSTKCKLFLKKDNKYDDRGKGFIHLKKGGDSDNKTQLVIRSDNALGSILLNIMVDTARIDKVGDNNILLATVPNPPIPGEESGPATFLIRVKTELRDELFDHLHKQ